MAFFYDFFGERVGDVKFFLYLCRLLYNVDLL